MKRIMLLLVAVLAGPAVRAEMKDVPHPFILWTKEEAKAIRNRIDNDPLARKQYEKMAATEISRVNPTWWNLFQYLVMGDEAAGNAEKTQLLKFIGRVPDPMTAEFKAKLDDALKEVGGDWDKIWTRGNSSVSDAHQRDEQTLNTLRYDVLYDLLSSEERTGVQTAMRAYIQFHLDGAKPRHPDFRYTRMGWLPNMHWPRPIGTHLMAVALKDPKAIEAMFQSDGGWKWFFDSYVTDGGFYNEEFCKYYSNIGTMMLYGQALERLGLGQFGFGYTGKGGATMRQFLAMPLKVGFPRVNFHGRSRFIGVTMGDAGTFELFNWRKPADVVPQWWSTAHMNGPLPKLQAPGWYELGYKHWPEDGYAFFLAHMRAPDEEVYLPSLYFGVPPIDPKKTAPPAAPSYVTRERGFALLRADESPAYWESPAPAVAMQFGMYYVHYVHDCFAMLNYIANNRVIYERMGMVKKGYAGGDPWRNHVNGQSSGVVVDGLRPAYVDGGEEGCKNQRIREHLAGPAKFVACRARGIYPDVDQERAFILTRDYLCDIFWLNSDKPRVYDWHVMSAGHVASPGNWGPVKTEKVVITNQQSIEVGKKPWTAVIHQNASPDQGGGVRVAMLEENTDTVLTQGRPPITDAEMGVKLIASRTASSTMFIALHQPYDGPAANAPAARFSRIGQTDGAVAVGVNHDRVLFSHADSAGKEQTVTGDGESYTFTDFGFIRVGNDTVEVTGSVTAAKIKVTGNPKLVVNGTAQSAKISGGMLTW